MKRLSYSIKTFLVTAVIVCMGLVAKSQVTVVATAATMGPTVYADLNSAFAAINAGTHQGIIGIGISANTVEAGPCILNSSGAGAALYTAITIAPTVDGVSISATTTSGRGVIELKGADNVTIDGDNPNTAGINRNLSINNTAANTVTYASCVRIANAATVVTSSDNVTIKNCILNGSATGRNVTGATSTTGSENTTFGIYVGGNGGATATDAPTAVTSVTSTTAPTGTTVNTLLIDNNVINAAARAIVLNGNAATVINTATVSNNTIGGSGVLSTYPFTTPATTVYTKAVWINGVTGISITGNTIQNILSYVSTTMTGIELVGAIGAGTINIANNNITCVTNNGTSNGTKGILLSAAGAPYTISGNTVSTIQDNTSVSQSGIEVNTSAASGIIQNNIVSGVYARSTGGYGAFAIQLTAGSAITVQNNFIYDLNAVDNNSATSTLGPIGIRIAAGSNHKIYYNSINLAGAALAGGSAAEPSACLMVTTTSVTGIDVRNNLFQNTRTGSFAGSANVCIDLPSGMTSSAAYTINNNVCYSPVGTNFYLAILSSGTTYSVANFNPAAITPATNWRSYTSGLSVAGTNDNASFASSAAAPFISGTNLHINNLAANASDLDGKAAVVSTTTDIDGTTRNAATPDVGADEFVLPNCVASSGGTISPATQTLCAGATASMSSTGASAGLGISYQWMVGAASGGPYVNVTGGSGALTTSYVSAPLTPGTYYYVLQTTCSFGPSTGLSNELTVTVNPNPTVGVSPTAGAICLPGGSPVTLTASGAITYTWSPTTALTPTTGSPVSANPAVTTTYVVTGTAANGCVGTATAVITVASTPTVTVSGNPTSVCFGGNSQLNAAVSTTSYTLSSITPNILTPVSPTTISTWTNTGNDDGSAGPFTLPFSFTFYGISYTQYYLGTNGYLSFNSLAAETGLALRAPQTFPSTSTPNNLIALCMSDLHQTGTAITSTFVTGIAPNRVFVMDYTTVPFYDGIVGTGNVTGQIQLFESTNVIEIHVNTVNHGTNTGNQTLGIENATGTLGSSPAGRNNTLWNVSTPEAYRWTPGPFTYSWSPVTFLNNGTIANPMASAITATTSYTATVTSAEGCIATGSVTITSGSALTTTASVLPAASVCAGTDVTLGVTPVGGGAPYSYTWTGPNSFASTSQNPTITGATPAATGVYTATVTDNCAVVSTVTVSLTVNALPVVAVTPLTALYCNPGTPITLTASGATTYSWGPAAGLSATTGTSVDATPATTTAYTVTGTDGNGCIATATTTITSAPAVTNAAATATPGTICAGSPTDLEATADPVIGTILMEDFNSGAPAWTRTNTSTGGTPANAAWIDRPDGFVYAAGIPYHSNDNTQFVQTNSDAQGSGSTTRTTLQSPAFSTVGYSGLSLDFYNYYRDINDNGDSAVVEASLDGISWLILTSYTATSGVENAFTHSTLSLPAGLENQPTVYVRFRFIATWDWYWSIDNVTITGLSPNFTYDWTSTPVGFTSTAQNPTGVMPTASSTYTVEITNAFGCSATASTGVTVNPLPTVSLGPDVTQCAGSVVLDAQNAGATYLWSDNSTTQTITVSTTGLNDVAVMDANGCVGRDTVMITINPLPVVNLGTDVVQCAGSVTLDAQNAGATYLWNDNSTSQMITVSATGTSDVTVTDANGCVNSDTIMVTINPLPVVNLGADVVQCGGSVTLDAQNQGATYLWNDNSTTQMISVSATGTSDVAVMDANGCVGYDTVMVTINPLPVVNLGADVVQCGGSVMLDAQNAGANYLWNDGSTTQMVTVSTTGLSDVAVTDANGCVGHDTVMVTINTPPTVALGLDVTQCGGTVNLDAQNQGSTYLWQDNTTAQTLTASATGQYYVTVLDGNGCTGSDTVMVTINTIPTVTFTFATNSSCIADAAMALSGGSPAGGTYSGPGVTGTTFNPATAGVGSQVITYSYTDANGCSDVATHTIAVDSCLGVHETTLADNINLYPNPNNGVFTISINGGNYDGVTIEIFTVEGQVLSSEKVNGVSKDFTHTVNLSAYANGTYLVKVIADGQVTVKKVYKQD